MKATMPVTSHLPGSVGRAKISGHTEQVNIWWKAQDTLQHDENATLLSFIIAKKIAKRMLSTSFQDWMLEPGSLRSVTGATFERSALFLTLEVEDYRLHEIREDITLWLSI